MSIFEEKCVSLRPENMIKEEKIMARPIKETPILYGEEAKKFEIRMMNPQQLSQEQQERIQQDYEFMRSRCINCTF